MGNTMDFRIGTSGPHQASLVPLGQFVMRQITVTETHGHVKYKYSHLPALVRPTLVSFICRATAPTHNYWMVTSWSLCWLPGNLTATGLKASLAACVFMYGVWNAHQESNYKFYGSKKSKLLKRSTEWKSVTTWAHADSAACQLKVKVQASLMSNFHGNKKGSEHTKNHLFFAVENTGFFCCCFLIITESFSVNSETGILTIR